MTLIEENIPLNVGDVVISQSKYAPSFGSMKRAYLITGIVGEGNTQGLVKGLVTMYLVQDLENVNKKYYFVKHNFTTSLNFSYFLL